MTEQENSLFPTEVAEQPKAEPIAAPAVEAEKPVEATPTPTASQKQPGADRTLGEAAAEIGVATHVLRFWETKFTQLTPLRRGNRRFYRPADMEVLHQIQDLLKDEGMTIAGAGAKLKGDKKSNKASISSAYQAELLAELKALRSELI